MRLGTLGIRMSDSRKPRISKETADDSSVRAVRGGNQIRQLRRWMMPISAIRRTKVQFPRGGTVDQASPSSIDRRFSASILANRMSRAALGSNGTNCSGGTVRQPSSSSSDRALTIASLSSAASSSNNTNRRAQSLNPTIAFQTHQGEASSIRDQEFIELTKRVKKLEVELQRVLCILKNNGLVDGALSA